jgi:hypothetical protein
MAPLARVCRNSFCLLGLLCAHLLPAFELSKLFNALDLSHPGLEAAQAAWQAGDEEAASAALLRYYRERSPLPNQDQWLSPFTGEAAAIKRADYILNDEYELQGSVSPIPRTPEGHIDWESGGPRNDPEWAWMLNRMAYFEDLYLAWEQTGADRYLERLSADLVDWVEHSPYPDRLTFSAGWRPLEVARRILNSWTHMFLWLQDEKAFSDEARLALLSSLPEHADALADHASFWGGNHLLTETTALATIAVAWPEFREADDWRHLAIERYHRELLDQTYPDGAYKELSNHYHKVVWQGAHRFLALLRAAPGDTADGDILEELADRTEALRRYFAEVERPDGKGPLNNAADREDNRWQLQLLGAESRPQAGISWFPWAGHAVMRNRLEDPTEWAFFDLGPYGSAHQHEDALSLELWMDGGPFLADRGRYLYQPGPWSDYFKGPTAHNGVLLDGNAPLPGPRTVSLPLSRRVEITDHYAIFGGQAVFPPAPMAGRGTSFHRRTLIYFPNGGWIVLDALETTGSHRTTTWWNFAPGVVEGPILEEQLSLIAASDARGPVGRGEIRSYFGSEEPIAGWQSEQFGEKTPALARSHTFHTRGPSLLAWAITPTTSTWEVKVLEASARTLRLELFTENNSRHWQLEATATPKTLELSISPLHQ